ncbi:putative NADPH-dependent methylglyoxal reductase Grp2p [[Candida] anglica]|uniref:NADPH-dependent methylglyoxal reductase Grp2p n=1 Tax=[Candida] anglica TaxID=148631 RepID=A0ABP0EEC2_9ASCO
MATSTVFVSGANGFIAQHIIKQLIAKGYNVIGSVRTAEKGDALKKNLNSDKFQYAIVRDIQVEGAFNEVFKNHPEITIVLHTASPLSFVVTDFEKDLLIPAVDGTKNALNAVIEFAPQVTNVVVTSSCASIYTLSKEKDASVTFDESSWNEITWEQAKENALTAYIGSKTFAEKAAWDIMETKKPHFTLTTVNPMYVFGPQAFNSEVKDTLNASAEIINNIIKLKSTDDVPALAASFVDVRDVAAAHIVAFENKQAASKRLLLSSSTFSSQGILEVLNENFSTLKGKLPVGKPGTSKEDTDKLARFNNDATRKILGFEFIDLKKCIIDSVEQVLAVKGKI